MPLSALEEAVLIVTTGLTGFMLHDGPLDLPRGGKGLGTPMVQTPARAAGSPDNTQATSFFLINDSGVWLIKKLKKLNLLSEPDGERALFLDDWRPFVPRTLRASAGSRCAKTIRSRMRVEFADLRHGFHAKAHSYQMAVSAIGRRDAESRHPPQSIRLPQPRIQLVPTREI